MKVCTLRKVDGGIVATVDEYMDSIIIDDFVYHIQNNSYSYMFHNTTNSVGAFRIIAFESAAFGKELIIIGDRNKIKFNKKYPYTETADSVVIKL